VEVRRKLKEIEGSGEEIEGNEELERDACNASVLGMD